jgi:hypothetical protein
LNFDFGNVLTRAGQITWKHKVLWFFSALPMFVSFLIFPFVILTLFFLPDTTGQSEMFRSAEVILPILFLAGLGFIFLVSFLLNGLSMAAATLGVLRAERGEGDLSLAGLLNDSRPYIGRMFAVYLIINLTIGLVFTLFFLAFFLLTIVTMGMASICLQPVMILIAPFSFLVLGVLESAQAAVIVDDMSALDAVKRGLMIVRENIWKYIILTLVIYLGSSILTSFLMMPLMVPFFALSFIPLSSQQFDPQMMTVVILGFMCLFFPLTVIFQSLILTFTKSTLVLSYLHFSKAAKDSLVFVNSNE